MKVLCTSVDALPKVLDEGARAFTFFKSAKQKGVGTIAQGWRGSLKRKRYRPSPEAWDFLQLSLAICAADLCCPRNTSADGWTRVIDLTVALFAPAKWKAWEEHTSKLLKVLTGDYWTVRFVDGGVPPPNGRGKTTTTDCVSLLSGGLDSLIGGLDLVAQGRHPLFVSQRAYEDSRRQIQYAGMIGGADTHVQWSHGISFTGKRETSTRARSLAFYGFAVIAATTVPKKEVEIFIPENGFICINPPLVPGRSSSLSTRTTHPLFIEMLQVLLSGIGIPVALKLPYRFKTKGQMMSQCLDQTTLRSWAADTTSCGRFRTYNRRHCGRCVPCMIRKAAFLAWGGAPDTTDYVHVHLATSGKSTPPDDPMAAALAVLAAKTRGVDTFLGASLAFAAPGDRPAYRTVVAEGLAELEALLKGERLL
jgi:hypothetical protein